MGTVHWSASYTKINYMKKLESWQKHVPVLIGLLRCCRHVTTNHVTLTPVTQAKSLVCDHLAITGQTLANPQPHWGFSFHFRPPLFIALWSMSDAHVFIVGAVDRVQHGHPDLVCIYVAPYVTKCDALFILTLSIKTSINFFC